MYAYSEAVFGSTAFLQANTKSCAVTGSPFDHFAFLRNLIVNVFPLLDSFGSPLAIPGIASSFPFNVYNH